mmetsp:Transcript_10771/g.13485  ORF Transcript_10771/g.13485 Transcript_10771/m.13485 type:complete len:174 (+) Transcript_10771:3029-3550(+)
MIVVLAVTFLYSGAMPILYASAGAFFFVTYWVDKCLLLRCYRKPVQFDNYMASATISFFKYIIVLHLLSFLIMYGLTPILPTRIDIASTTDPSQIQFKTKYGDFTLYSGYVWVCLIILAVFILLNLPFRAVKGCIAKCFKKAKLEQEIELNFCDDFFECVSYATLKDRLIKTQ